MLTELTGTIEFWIAFSTALMLIGAYKLITKQNSERIKALDEKFDSMGEKFDNMRFEIKLDQSKIESNFEHMSDTMNRIGKDTTIMREKTNDLSQAVGKLEVRLKSLENGSRHNEFV